MIGVAIDIGTTTVQAQLVKINTGEILDKYSAFNDQRCFGSDVITRINAAQNGKLNDLSLIINRQIESILQNFKYKWNLGGIPRCNITGNTTMLHLFCRTDPSSMGITPYIPMFLNEQNFAGSDLYLSADHITLLPGISAFIGADITAGLAFINILKKNDNAIFIDIGTNGEIALWKADEKRLFCCSAAAGSCFEEAEIIYGLYAKDFINAIAEMKNTKVINETGALAKKYKDTGFCVSEGIVLYQKDVRQFQMAKSAIYSGIKTICRKANVELKKINTVYFAGGIGFHINYENAAEVGLIPKEFAGKTNNINLEICGNTSLKGAAESLTNSSFLSRCCDVISCAETIDLANDKYFIAAFTHNLNF